MDIEKAIAPVMNAIAFSFTQKPLFLKNGKKTKSYLYRELLESREKTGNVTAPYKKYVAFSLGFMNAPLYLYEDSYRTFGLEARWYYLDSSRFSVHGVYETEPKTSEPGCIERPTVTRKHIGQTSNSSSQT